MILNLFRLQKCIRNKLFVFFSVKFTNALFFLHKINHGTFVSAGVPIIDKAINSNFIIGNDFVIVNEPYTATLGKNNRCKFVLNENATLKIGNKVGISNTTIVSTKSIIIGNNVMIGGGVTIVDSDFHSLNPLHWHTKEDEKNMVSLPVIIKDNVFIGMDSIILKGVSIGSNSIIAAGSVVSKSIPDNEIWGGNPAVFIKNKEI